MAIRIEHDRPNCIGCLMPETLIVGPYGAKPIKEIQVGDLVLTSNGTFQPVTGVMAHHHEGKIFELKIRSMGSIQITEEHPVLIVRRNVMREHKEDPFVFDWLEAGQLQNGDYAVFPKVNNPFLAHIGLVPNSSSSSGVSLMKINLTETQ